MDWEQWHEWDYIELLMNVVWKLFGGEEKLRPSWKCCPCGDMLAILVRLRILPRGWVDPQRAAQWLRRQMASASPTKLSDELGYTREYLSRLKSGQRDQPTFETFVRILLALGIGVPFLASIFQVTHKELKRSTQTKKRRTKKLKGRGRPRQDNAINFWSFRISFWVSENRDLGVIWRGEVTRETAQVTDPKPPEVTPEVAEVTLGAPEVTRRPRGEITRRAPEAKLEAGHEGAGTPTPFMTVECREEDPSPELGALLSKLAEEATYPMSASRVAEMREDWARRANERRAHKRRAHKRGANERGANERGQARIGVGPRSASARGARAERPKTSGGRAAGAVGDVPEMPSSSETIPMIFSGVYGVFAPLDPQPTAKPPGTILVSRGTPRTRSHLSARPKPTRGQGDEGGQARGIGKLSQSPRGHGLRAQLDDAARTRDADGDLAVALATAKAQLVDERSARAELQAKVVTLEATLADEIADRLGKPRSEGLDDDLLSLKRLIEELGLKSTRSKLSSAEAENKTFTSSANPARPRQPTPRPTSAVARKWWTRVPPLPTEGEVPGFDLVTNWGTTPKKLRPLFALMEEVSRIRGSARIFAVIAKREADFQPAAHDDHPLEAQASRRVYVNARDRNRPLTYGEAAADFGSGGLFGPLAPYFLWTGVQEMKGDAPLLAAPPEVLFIPRVAAFGAVVYLQRLLTNYQIDDLADIKAGWASPGLLRGFRGGTVYNTVRNRFLADATDLGVDLDDTSTIPKPLSAELWPGGGTAFTSLTGITVAEAKG